MRNLFGPRSARPIPDRLSWLALIIANLIPLIGVLGFDWDIAPLVLIYWLENLVVGFYNLLKMATVHGLSVASALGRLFFMGFFSIHYGGFCAVHGFFLVHFLQLGPEPDLSSQTALGPLIFLDMLVAVVLHVWQQAGALLLWPLLAIGISHGVSFLQNFWFGGERQTLTVNRLMGQPYGRIVMLHVAILGAAFFILKLGSPLPLLIAIILFKILLDLTFHWRSHRKADQRLTASPPTGRPNV